MDSSMSTVLSESRWLKASRFVQLDLQLRRAEQMNLDCCSTDNFGSREAEPQAYMEFKLFQQLLRTELQAQEVRFQHLLENNLRSIYSGHPHSSRTPRDTDEGAPAINVLAEKLAVQPEIVGNDGVKVERVPPKEILNCSAPADRSDEIIDELEKVTDAFKTFQPIKIPSRTSYQSIHSAEDGSRKSLNGRLIFPSGWVKVQKVDQTKPLNAMVLSQAFNHLSSFVVVLNSIQLGYSAEYALAHINSPSNTLIDVADMLFCVFYLVELCLKIMVFRCQFFYNQDWAWNWFDSFLVIFTVNEEISKYISDEGEGGGNAANIFRIIKIVKTIKMLRFIHAMNFFRELRHFLVPIVQSLRALFWTLLMLSMILYVFAIIFLQGVVNHLVNEKADADPLLREHFGSVASSMTSLYMAVTGGNDWSVYADAIKVIGDHYYYFFFLYIAFLTFAVLNILTGIFVDSAMQYSNEDRDSRSEELEANINLKSKVLLGLLEKGNDTGLISMADFKSRLETQAMMDFLQQMDLTRNDAQMMMHRLTKDQPEGVTLETFLDCAIYFKGPARSLHLHELIAESRSVASEMRVASKSQRELTGLLADRLLALESKFAKSTSGSILQFVDQDGVAVSSV